MRAELSRQAKLKSIHDWRASGKKVAMVGDGINDAPSLTAADISIGMGARGSDAALEQADVVLMHDKIENVEEAFVLSRRARSVIRQNVIISLGVILFLIVSALAEKINLTAGVIGHESSTVVVILNRPAPASVASESAGQFVERLILLKSRDVIDGRSRNVQSGFTRAQSLVPGNDHIWRMWSSLAKTSSLRINPSGIFEQDFFFLLVNIEAEVTDLAALQRFDNRQAYPAARRDWC